jgi:hypothetical protein
MFFLTYFFEGEKLSETVDLIMQNQHGEEICLPKTGNVPVLKSEELSRIFFRQRLVVSFTKV